MAEDAAVLKELQKIPNIGPACAKDLLMLGIRQVEDLRGKDADELYDRLCVLTSSRQDPCVADTLESAVSFANGNPGQPWWHFTEGRKKRWKKAGR